MASPPLALDPDLYIPPQITETWGETQFTDCVWCSGFGLIDLWTTGAVTKDRAGRSLSQARLKSRREDFREASGDVAGGSTLIQLAAGTAKHWPDLPKLRTTSTADLPGWDGLWPMLEEHHSIVLLGNPSAIPNQSSFLRTAQGSDDYDHAILVVRAGPEAGLCMDPLRPSSSKPRWVPRKELRQFASGYGEQGHNPSYAIVRRGAQSALGSANAEIVRLKAQLAGQPPTCDEAVAEARARGIADAASAAAAVK